MIVQCPKCKAKLRVDDTRIKPEGSRMKCPRCAVVLLVRPPKQRPPVAGPAQASPAQAPPAQTPQRQPEATSAAPPSATAPVSIPPGLKVLVAHGNAAALNQAVGILMGAGCSVSTAPDGVEALVKTQQEEPDLVLIDVALPKIYGFEVAKRLRDQDPSSGMGIILITSVHKEDRYRREPASLYGADAFVEEPFLQRDLLSSMSAVLEKRRARPLPPVTPEEPAPAPAAPEEAPGGSTVSPQDRERAQRLSRTILSDIELYSPDRVAEAIRAGNFETVFRDELAEGRKLYEARMSADVRAERDYFQETVRTYIERKEQEFGTA